MELRHLRYFVTVAETLNYRRAAERLRVAQPALSKQIKDLEHHVGAQLLNRNTGGVSLTDAGSVFFEEALDILERAEMAIDAVQEAKNGRRGRLNIGSLGAMSASFLPAALSLFRTQFPKVEVHLAETSLQDQHSELKTGRIQVGFSIDRENDEHFESFEVFNKTINVVMSPEHAFASKSSVSLHDLAHEQFFCMGETERHDIHRRRIEAVLSNRGIRHHPLKRISSIGSLFTLVSSNHGISLALPLSSHSSDVVFRPIQEEGDDLNIQLLAIWLKGTKSQLAKNFISTLSRLKENEF